MNSADDPATPSDETPSLHFAEETKERDYANDGVELNLLPETATLQVLAFRKSQQQLKLLEECVARMSDSVLVTDAQTFDEPGPRILFVNDSFERITGYSREEVIGKTPRLLQGPKTQRSELDRLRAALERWEPVRVELINYTKTGREFWVEIDISPVMDRHGWPTHWVAVQRDISARKKSEEALRESEERFKNVARATADALWDWNLETQAHWWSEGMQKLFGFSADELEPGLESWITRIHSDDRERVRKGVYKAITEGGTNWTEEYRFLRRDGSYAYVLDRGFVIRRTDGEPVRMVGGMTDLSERKISEEKVKNAVEALKTSEAQYRLLFHHNPQPMWAYDADSLRFLAVNRAAIARYGYSEEEFLAMNILQIRPAEDVAQNESAQTALRANSNIFSGIGRHRLRDGTVIDVEVSADAIVFNSRPARLVLAHDVTERIRVEKALARINRAQRMLSSCNEALIRADEEHLLLLEICQIAVEIGGYSLASVGYAQNNVEKSIVPKAFSGREASFVSEVADTWSDDSPLGDGVAGRTVRRGVVTVCEDITRDPTMAPWIVPALRCGFRGVICLPLRDSTRTFGLLSLYSSDVRRIEDDEIKLLQELADDLAFGIRSIRLNFERQRLQGAILKVASSVSASSGTAFFDQLARNMAEAIGAQASFVVRFLPDAPTRMRTVATIIDGKTVANADFDFEGTPCADLKITEEVVVLSDLAKRFPRVPVFEALGVQAYVGRRLENSAGQAVGLVAVLFRDPLVDHEFISSTLRIFASRAAGELERQDSDARLLQQASLLDKAQDAIFVRDLNYRITFWNKGAERIYGWTAVEALGQSSRDLLYPDRPEMTEALEQLMATGEWSGEIEHRRRGDRTVTVEARWTLVRDDLGKPHSVLSINTDITERKKIENQFLRAQRVESIGTLAGGIAHDLNNVLAPIMMSIGLLKLTPRDQDELRVLNTIELSARRGADMVRQVLSFARGVEGHHLPTPPRHLIADVASVIAETFPKSIHCEVNVPPDIWRIMGDPTQLHQVLLNLSVNARDAMPNGGKLTIKASNLMIDEQYVKLSREGRAGPHVMIKVSDTGTGIPSDIRAKIFDPFFTTKDIGKGTGLGLATVMTIVRSHTGFIRLSSEVGIGTDFEVYFPADVVDEPLPPAMPSSRLPRGAGQWILIVDDEASVRTVSQRTLEAFGYRVISAKNGAEAVALYARHRHEIAAVITDMMMPIMDGPALIHALGRINPDVRVLAVSGLNAQGATSPHTRGKSKRFLSKPYTADTLLTVLNEVLTEQTKSNG